MAAPNGPPLHEWHKTISNQDYLISTSPALLSPTFINTAFATKDMSWAKPFSPSDLQTMISHSLTLGVYKLTPRFAPRKSASNPDSPRTPSPTLDDSAGGNDRDELEMVGMARFVTDYITMLYLTDVYISPAHRGGGLSTWLVECCNEVVESMPGIRRIMLLTDPKRRPFYEKALGAVDVDSERENLIVMTRKGNGGNVAEH